MSVLTMPASRPVVTGNSWASEDEKAKIFSFPVVEINYVSDEEIASYDFLHQMTAIFAQDLSAVYGYKLLYVYDKDGRYKTALCYHRKSGAMRFINADGVHERLQDALRGFPELFHDGKLQGKIRPCRQPDLNRFPDICGEHLHAVIERIIKDCPGKYFA